MRKFRNRRRPIIRLKGTWPNACIALAVGGSTLIGAHTLEPKPAAPAVVTNCPEAAAGRNPGHKAWICDTVAKYNKMRDEVMLLPHGPYKEQALVELEESKDQAVLSIARSF